MKKLFGKHFILYVALFFFTYSSYSQTEKKSIMGAHFAYGSGLYGGWFAAGGASNDTKCYYSLGVDYSRKLSNRWDLCSGLEYTYASIMVTPVYTGQESERTPHREYIMLGTIPVQFKRHFGRFIYLNGGLLFNILGRTSEDWTVKSRDGEYRSTHNLGMLLGCGVGVGFKYEFSSGVVCSINPNIRANGIGSVGSFVYFTQLKRRVFLQSGISLDVGYKF